MRVELKIQLYSSSRSSCGNRMSGLEDWSHGFVDLGSWLALFMFEDLFEDLFEAFFEGILGDTMI